jgi:CheY-like chemotaxis protein
MKLILVVEDNLELRENTAEMLEVSGYKVQTAENGLAGYEKALQYKPDTVVSDMMMPRIDGKGFLKLMKANDYTSGIPIVFFSAGTPGKKDIQHLVEQGDAYLKKPFTNDELLDTVARFCAPA